MSDYPGVSFKTKTVGGTIYVEFRNPFQGGANKTKSTKTGILKNAESIARMLSEAIHVKLDDMRNDYPQIIYDILEVKPLGKKIELAKKSFVDSKTLADSPSAALGSKSSMEHYISIAKANEDVLDEVQKFRAQMEYWRGKAVAAEAALGRRVSEAEANSGPRSVKAASKAFLTPDTGGTKATGQYRYNVQQWIERFAADVGEETDCMSINPERVIQHLAEFKAQTKVKDIVAVICQFLTWATHGQFERAAVRRWLESVTENREANADETEWFWLTRDECEKLIKQLEKDAGAYWADAASLQYGCGFRPEEIPLLRTDAVTIKGEVAAIVVKRPRGRRLKTKKSQDAVNVPIMALEALRRRIAATVDMATLFPFSQSGCELAPHLAERRAAQDAETDLWPSADDHEFSGQFLKRLRAAASKVLTKKRAGQVDSRTLRRTCGRELILKYKSFEAAAAVLRNDPATLRRHYATLLSSDISTER